eukprot:316092_1
MTEQNKDNVAPFDTGDFQTIQIETTKVVTPSDIKSNQLMENKSDNLDDTSLHIHHSFQLNRVDSFIDHVFQQKSDSDDESDGEEAFCFTCGDRIHDLQKFMQNEHNCQECTSLKELGILKMVSLQFTIDFFDYIVYGISFSPMIWVWIPLIDESPTLLISVISIYLIIAGICLIIFIHYLYKHKVVVLHKIPLGLIPINNYTYIMMTCILISNILVIIESLRVYCIKHINVVFACNNIYTFGRGNIPSHCLIYSHLLSTAMIIFISSLLINLIIMRGIKYDAKKSWKKVKEEVIPTYQRGYQYFDNLEKRYYSIHKFKRSSVPTIQMFIRRHAKYSIAWFRAIIIEICSSVFCLVVSCCSFYILGNDFITKLNNHQIYYLPVIISIICSNIMFNFLLVSFYELSWVFEKAYAVMRVCTEPFKDACSIHQDMSVKYNNSEYFQVAQDDKSSPGLQSKSFIIYNENDVNVNDIKIWWDLRSFGFKTLPLFYEVSDPIMSTLVISVIGLTIFFLYDLFVTFENEVAEYKQSIKNDNIRFILCVFTAFLIVQLLYELRYFLRPYSVLYSQIKMAEKQVIALRFEIVNEQKNAVRKKYLSECIDLYVKLIGFMQIEMTTQAPKILGIKVTHSKLKALQSYIIAFIVVFAGMVWEDWLSSIHSLGSN